LLHPEFLTKAVRQPTAKPVSQILVQVRGIEDIEAQHFSSGNTLLSDVAVEASG
jgi:hypothetical protein